MDCFVCIRVAGWHRIAAVQRHVLWCQSGWSYAALPHCGKTLCLCLCVCVCVCVCVFGCMGRCACIWASGSLLHNTCQGDVLSFSLNCLLLWTPGSLCYSVFSAYKKDSLFIPVNTLFIKLLVSLFTVLYFKATCQFTSLDTVFTKCVHIWLLCVRMTYWHSRWPMSCITSASSEAFRFYASTVSTLDVYEEDPSQKRLVDSSYILSPH